MYAMCSVTPAIQPNVQLSSKLLPRGLGAKTSSLNALYESGNSPSKGYIKPLPSFRLVDIDADGLADIIISIRLNAVKRHFNCNDPTHPLASPESFQEQTLAVVFRNNGAGWNRDY